MKRHVKTKKMSQIRVAILKRAKLQRSLKKNPKGLASLAYKKCVSNCTIPQPDTNNIIEIECPWNKNRKLVGTKDTAIWTAGKWYKEARTAAYNHINASKKKKELEGIFYRNKRRPWFMLSARQEKEMYNKTIPKRMTREERWEALAQAKLAKWEKKNPCPIKDNVNEPDLFEAQYLPQWQAERDAALERFRDFVVSVYDKLRIVGNRVVKEPHGHMKGSTVAEVKDVDGKGHDVSYPNLKQTDKLYKNATKAATIAMEKDQTIVDCSLKNHKKTQTRPLIDAKRSYKQAA